MQEPEVTGGKQREEGKGAPLAALFFSKLRSRAILDFWPLPPPMVDGSADDGGRCVRCPAPPGGRPRAAPR